MSEFWDNVRVINNPNEKEIIVSFNGSGGYGAFGSNNPTNAENPGGLPTDPGNLKPVLPTPEEEQDGTADSSAESEIIPPVFELEECKVQDCTSVESFVAVNNMNDYEEYAKLYEVYDSGPYPVLTNPSKSGYDPATGDVLPFKDLPEPANAGGILNFAGNESEVRLWKRVYPNDDPADIAAAEQMWGQRLASGPCVAAREILDNGQDGLCKTSEKLAIGAGYSADQEALMPRYFLGKSSWVDGRRISNVSGERGAGRPYTPWLAASPVNIGSTFSATFYLAPYNWANGSYDSPGPEDWRLPRLGAIIRLDAIGDQNGIYQRTWNVSLGASEISIINNGSKIRFGFATSTDPIQNKIYQPEFDVNPDIIGTGEGWWSIIVDERVTFQREDFFNNGGDVTVSRYTNTNSISVYKDGYLLARTPNTFLLNTSPAFVGSLLIGETQLAGAPIPNSASDSNGSYLYLETNSRNIFSSAYMPCVALDTFSGTGGRLFEKAFSRWSRSYTPPPYCDRT